VLGSAELMVVGVLNLIAADLRVSIPAAGTLIQPGIAFGSFAAGVALGNVTASATVLAGLASPRSPSWSRATSISSPPVVQGSGADPRGRVTQPGSPLDLEGTMTWRAP
jgi:hypothetical protein